MVFRKDRRKPAKQRFLRWRAMSESSNQSWNMSAESRHLELLLRTKLRRWVFFFFFHEKTFKRLRNAGHLDIAKKESLYLRLWEYLKDKPPFYCPSPNDVVEKTKERPIGRDRAKTRDQDVTDSLEKRREDSFFALEMKRLEDKACLEKKKKTNV